MGFLDGITANPAMAKLQAAVAFTARRHEVIANNIANITTPGYRAKDLSEKKFVEALDDAEGRLDEAIKLIDSPDAGPVRDDGNNVNIEREMTKLSGNSLMHNVLISMLDKQFKMLETALKDKL
jgi:flagellar basal-body rod protein FlgB